MDKNSWTENLRGKKGNIYIFLLSLVYLFIYLFVTGALALIDTCNITVSCSLDVQKFGGTAACLQLYVVGLRGEVLVVGGHRDSICEKNPEVAIS